MTESLCQSLGLSRSRSSISVNGIGNQPVASTRGLVTCILSPHFESDFQISVTMLVLRQLTTYSARTSVPLQSWPHLDGLTLADPDCLGSARIDLLLGADVLGGILEPGLKKGPPECPIAQNTALGWVLSGAYLASGESSVPAHRSSSLSLHCSGEADLDLLLQRFWEQEDLPPAPTRSPEEDRCEAHYASTHSRTTEGRYVRLPFRQDPSALGDSRTTARHIFNRTERRLLRDPALHQAYVRFMDEYAALGHKTPLGAESLVVTPSPHYFLPHHGVVRSTSPHQIRVVFNGSHVTSTGTALNHTLMPGPKLQSDLADLLTMETYSCFQPTSKRCIGRSSCTRRIAHFSGSFGAVLTIGQ